MSHIGQHPDLIRLPFPLKAGCVPNAGECIEAVRKQEAVNLVDHPRDPSSEEIALVRTLKEL
jgi:hypothetical protein